MTSQGPIKCDGIFISRLLEGGLAESTGLLGVGDEVVEVNGIEVFWFNDKFKIYTYRFMVRHLTK